MDDNERKKGGIGMEFIYPACIERERKHERETNETKIKCLDMHGMELGISKQALFRPDYYFILFLHCI